MVLNTRYNQKSLCGKNGVRTSGKSLASSMGKGENILGYGKGGVK